MTAIKTKMTFSICAGLALLWLTGCQAPPTLPQAATPTQPPAKTATVTVPPPPTAPPANTPTTLPTATPSPSPTVLPTANHTPTATPSPTATALPWGAAGQVIGPENAALLVQRASFGLGAIRSTAFAAQGKTALLKTEYSLVFYDTANDKVLNSAPDCDTFFISPDGATVVAGFLDGHVEFFNALDGSLAFRGEAIAKYPWWVKEEIQKNPPESRDSLSAYYARQFLGIKAAAFSVDHTQAAVAFGDLSIGIWSLTEQKMVKTLYDQVSPPVEHLVFSPGKNYLLLGNSSGDFAVWNNESDKLLWSIPNTGHFNGMPFSPDGSLFAAEVKSNTSQDTQVMVFRSAYREKVGEVVGRVGTNPISPDNQYLLTTWYGDVSVWYINKMNLVKVIHTSLNWPAAAFSEDGQTIVLNQGEQAYRLSDYSRDDSYPRAAGQNQPELNFLKLFGHGYLPPISGWASSAPRDLTAWGQRDEQTIWWQDLFQAAYQEVNLGSPITMGTAFSPAADWLAACTKQGLVVVHLADLKQADYSLCREKGLLEFAPDGKTLFRVDTNVIDAIDPQSGELRYQIRGHRYNIWQMNVSKSGKNLVSAAGVLVGEFELFLWRIDNPAKVNEWSLPAQSLQGFDVSPDGAFVAANGRVLRASDGWQVKVLPGGSLAAFSPDGALLALAGMPGSAQLYRTSDWAQVGEVKGQRQALSDLRFSADGASLVTTSLDGTLVIWGLPAP